MPFTVLMARVFQLEAAADWTREGVEVCWHTSATKLVVVPRETQKQLVGHPKDITIGVVCAEQELPMRRRARPTNVDTSAKSSME